MIKTYLIGKDVVTMARIRIKNVFESSQRIRLSISGGKDSIVLNDLVFKMVQSGEVDGSKLEVDFIDEEAIFPCVERVVKNIRFQWLSIGVKFNWFCIQVKHFNCFNSLSQDESFICWDETKKDVWVRDMPPYAITNHPLLIERTDSYQTWYDRMLVNEQAVRLVGLRCAESVQRRSAVANALTYGNVRGLYPIYDWKDSDIWKYISDEGLEIPEAYIYMFQVGIPKNQLRISQFFSVDTAKSLVQMCEFYPDLFDRICKREPNAYLAMLYYDTEFFRHKKNKSKEKDTNDYKDLALKAIIDPNNNNTKLKKDNVKSWKNVALKFGLLLNNNEWKMIYEGIVGGDPKNRALRAFYTKFSITHVKECY